MHYYTHTTVTIVTSVCLVTSSLSVFLKIWTRKRLLSAGLRTDDYTMLVALLFYGGYCICWYCLAAVQRRCPVLERNAANRLLTLESATESMFLTMSIFWKLSLCIFFRRFLVERWQQRLLYHVATVYIIMASVGIPLAIFQCGLPNNQADKRAEGGKCVSYEVLIPSLIVFGSLSALTDWILALLPFTALLRSRMRVTEKVSAGALMALAVCASIIAIIRTVTSPKIAFYPERYYNPDYRPTYYHIFNEAVVFATLEAGIGLTAASLACCRPLVRRCTSHWRSVVSSFGCDNTANTDDIEKQPAVRISGVTLAPLPVRIGVLPTLFEETIDTFDSAVETSSRRSLGVLPAISGDTPTEEYCMSEILPKVPKDTIKTI